MSKRTGLQHEIGKRQPFDLLEQEAYLNLVRTASRLGVPFGRLFRELGLSEAGYNVLRILRGAGSPGRTCGEISAHVVAAVPDITRLIDRLEREGLAARRRTAEDRRQVVVTLTAKGKRTLAALDEPIRELHRRQLGHLKPSELRTLNALLVKARRPPAE
ncbi:MAG: MarR family transcriptional regulator [Phycisphaerales bacterium]|nr:MarR family transcriptional regulator [Phycisphaerales bacterium]